MGKRIWITWETQRRSIELARKFGCKLFLFDFPEKTRYLKCLWQTFIAIYTEKPTVIFAQNPSMILAFFVCVWSLVTGVPVVVDRHTTFLLSRKYRNTPRILLFKLLHRLTVRMATMTIVTNQFLAEIVEKLGGRAFVLPDKIPDLKSSTNLLLKGKQNILLISSCAKDEPIVEVLEAMRLISYDGITLYITGNNKKLEKAIIDNAPDNVIFTGFLPEQDFINYLFSVDCVMALTTAEYCMLCGCYEAVAAEKPLITSSKMVLQEYFNKAIFVDNTPSGIASGIQLAVTRMIGLQQDIVLLKSCLLQDWEEKYQRLEEQLHKFEKDLCRKI